MGRSNASEGTTVNAIRLKRAKSKRNYGQNQKSCYFCGQAYSASHECPAKGKTCNYCNKLNHHNDVEMDSDESIGSMLAD